MKSSAVQYADPTSFLRFRHPFPSGSLIHFQPRPRPHLSTVQVHDRTASLKAQIDSYKSPYITFVPLKIQDVYDDRIPGLLAGLRRESVWEPQGEASGDVGDARGAGDAGLKVDLGRAGRSRVEVDFAWILSEDV